MNNTVYFIALYIENFAYYIIGFLLVCSALIILHDSETSKRANQRKNSLIASTHKKDPKSHIQKSMIERIFRFDSAQIELSNTIENKIKRKKKKADKKIYFYIAFSLLSLYIYVVFGNMLISISALAFTFVVYYTIRRARSQKIIKEFLRYFPISLDIMVRGVRSGIHVVECFRIIRNEAPSPVSDEFAMLSDSLALGNSLEEAMHEMYQRVPLSEVGYLKTVLVLHRQSGGNLSENIYNLSLDVREKHRIQAKAKVLLTETRITTVVTITLPIVIPIIIYFAKPEYILPLFQTEKGQSILTFCVIWMILGFIVMRKMYAKNNM